MSNFMNAINKYRRAHWLATHHLKPLAKLYEMWIYLIHNSFIPSECEIGEGSTFGYKGIGVVVHKRAGNRKKLHHRSERYDRGAERAITQSP